ncbi:hypothetical protein [Nannocystis pusilla]|uniref:hypothetical protein n=1 Tax=Nannocystis pusilla TaxID=889268 RepID=UPI003DA1E2DA
MNKSTIQSTRLIGASMALLALVALPRTARADLEACGGIFLFAEAQCKFVPTEECMTSCEPVAMETACASRLYTECEGECTASFEVECVGSCETSCSSQCEADAETEDPPNAMGVCMSTCQQACNDECAGAEHQGECRSACAHTCGESCEPRCGDLDDEVACDTKCSAVCEGSCEASARSECQISCQSTRFSECKTEVVDVCSESCTQTGGAIFCDGQFLASSDLQACADELLAEARHRDRHPRRGRRRVQGQQVRGGGGRRGPVQLRDRPRRRSRGRRDAPLPRARGPAPASSSPALKQPGAASPTHPPTTQRSEGPGRTRRRGGGPTAALARPGRW